MGAVPCCRGGLGETPCEGIAVAGPSCSHLGSGQVSERKHCHPRDRGVPAWCGCRGKAEAVAGQVRVSRAAWGPVSLGFPGRALGAAAGGRGAIIPGLLGIRAGFWHIPASQPGSLGSRAVLGWQHSIVSQRELLRFSVSELVLCSRALQNPGRSCHLCLLLGLRTGRSPQCPGECGGVRLSAVEHPQGPSRRGAAASAWSHAAMGQGSLVLVAVASGAVSALLQVSHHPPAAAHHVYSKRGWTLWQEITIASKFRGKYLSIMPLGR